MLSLPQNQTIQLCFGFDGATPDELVLRLLLHRTLLAGQADVTCVYSADQQDPHKWPDASTQSDGTDRLQHDGNVRLTAPANWEAQRPTAAGDDQPGWENVKVASGGAALTDPLHWIGLRIANTTPAASITAGIDRFLFSSAPARNALTIRSPELLGRSNGQPFQEFTLANGPLHAPTGTSTGLVVEVGQGTPPTWEEWKVVDDLPAGPHHVCRVNPVTGVIMFGNFEDTTGEGHGAIPPDGTEIRARTYRYVAGGTSGNVAAERISILGTTLKGALLAGIGKVTNLWTRLRRIRRRADRRNTAPCTGRAQDARPRGHREDYENLARAATTDVVTVRCLAPRLKADGTPWTYANMTRAPGSVYVIVVPGQRAGRSPSGTHFELINEVKEYLDRRRDLTASLTVVGPRYLPVMVTAVLNVWQQAINTGIDQTQVVAETKKRINTYLHPTRGGPDGTGWKAGQPVFASDLFRAIMPPENIAYIGSLHCRPTYPSIAFPRSQPTAPRTIGTQLGNAHSA